MGPKSVSGSFELPIPKSKTNLHGESKVNKKPPPGKKQIKKGSISIGSRLSIKWAGGIYYTGTVTSYDKNEQFKYKITYDDTDVRRYNFYKGASSEELIAVNSHGDHHVKILKLVAGADNDNTIDSDDDYDSDNEQFGKAPNNALGGGGGGGFWG